MEVKKEKGICQNTLLKENIFIASPDNLSLARDFRSTFEMRTVELTVNKYLREVV